MRKSVIAGLALTAVVAQSAAWLAATWMLSVETARWARQSQTHGWTVSSSRESWGGWPFAASLIIDKAAIGGGGRYLPGGLAWSADHVVVSVSIAHPFTLRIAAEGQQFLRLAHAPDIGFVAGIAVARLPLGDARHGHGTLKLVDASGGIAGSRYPQDVHLGALSLSLDADQNAAVHPFLTVRLNVQASEVGLPDIGHWPLGATVASAGAKLLLTSPVLDRPRQESDSPGAAQAAAWRNGGGTFLVQDANLRWGPLAVTAVADLALDGNLQPAGNGTAEMRGTAPALDAATRAGVIAPGVALTAEAVLALMTHVQTPAGDAVRLPLRLHDSTISLGQIPVTRLPEIRW